MYGIWFAENPFNRGALPAAAACAVATKTLRIGAGVFNPYNRHPTLIAMEIGALDELAGGRVQLGIGSGIGFAIERMGFSYGKPLTTLREAIVIVRALLRGEEVTHAGTVFNINKVKLDYKPRADIPIFMAGRGDRSLEACGEIADGLIVSNMVTASFSAKAVTVVHDAARAAGRPLPEIVQYVPCIARPDREEAYRLAKQAVAEMVPAYWTLGQRLPAAKSRAARRQRDFGSGLCHRSRAAQGRRAGGRRCLMNGSSARFPSPEMPTIAGYWPRPTAPPASPSWR